jgi:predicted transcriptional regulator of viral defense system
MSGRVLGYREFQVLRIVCGDIAHRGQVRSYREIAASLGMKHKSHVCDTVARLERRGLVRRVGAGRQRTISVEQLAIEEASFGEG